LLKGPPGYYAWLAFLLMVISVGILAYAWQIKNGLVVSGMTNYVSWGLYIGNFTFLVGVAAPGGCRRGRCVAGHPRVSV